MKSIASLILVFLLGCRAQEQVLMQQNLMSDVGEVSYIDKKKGFVTVRWQCDNPPFRNQPCFKYLEFPIYLFEDIHLGDTLHLTK